MKYGNVFLFTIYFFKSFLLVSSQKKIHYFKNFFNDNRSQNSINDITADAKILVESKLAAGVSLENIFEKNVIKEPDKNKAYEVLKQCMKLDHSLLDNKNLRKKVEEKDPKFAQSIASLAIAFNANPSLGMGYISDDERENSYKYLNKIFNPKKRKRSE
jgi:hypothetical protein